jgi:acetyl esterase
MSPSPGVPSVHPRGAGLIHGYFDMGETSEAARLETQRARADFKAMPRMR